MASRVEQPLRIAVAGVLHETNSFAPFSTGLDAFAKEWIAGLDAFVARYGGTRTSMGGAIDAASAHGTILVPGLYAAATPSGMVTASAGESLLEEVTASVDSTTDGLLLIVHGAMVTEGYQDFEGELLRRLRERLGADYPIAITVDLHGNISPLMAEMADFIVGYDTYPHVDMYERAIEAFGLLLRYIRGEVAPVRALVHTGMLVVPQGMVTDAGIMQEVMALAFEWEKQPGILNVTVAGGFPYSDVVDAGMTFVVTADGDASLAERCAADLAAFAARHKERFDTQYLPPAEAVRAALAAPEGPVVLPEGADNVGGGAPGDSTHVLAELAKIDSQAPNSRALIVICDEQAVQAARDAGIGGHFSHLVGGRHDELHGAPVMITNGVVRTLFDGNYRHIGAYMTGQQAFMGLTAVVQAGNLTLVLTEKRTAPWDLGHVRSVGLWPTDYQIIVAKSAIAWQTAFGQFAKQAIHVDSPGCCSANLSHFTYRNLLRPIYPLDAGEPAARLALFGKRGAANGAGA